MIRKQILDPLSTLDVAVTVIWNAEPYLQYLAQVGQRRWNTQWCDESSDAGAKA